MLKIAGRTLRFLDLFKPIVRQTGKHDPRGTVLCSEPLLPERLANHELFAHLLAFFEGAGAPAAAERARAG